MARRPAITGTPQERRDLRRQRRLENRVQHVRDSVAQATNGRERVVVACNAVLAVSKRITEEARANLARAVADVATDADRPENWRDAQ